MKAMKKIFFKKVLIFIFGVIALVNGCAVHVGPIENKEQTFINLRNAISPDYEPLFLAHSVWFVNAVPFATVPSAIYGVITIDKENLYFLNWRDDKLFYEIALKKELKSFDSVEHIKKRMNEFLYLKSNSTENFIFYINNVQGTGIDSEQTRILYEMLLHSI